VIREPHDEAKSPMKPRGQTSVESGPSRRRSKRTKKPLPGGDAATRYRRLSISEWEIMYPVQWSLSRRLVYESSVFHWVKYSTQRL
jgi:hypothetical protein